MALILPSLYSELEGDALPAILEHLQGAEYLGQIVIGLDRADQQQYQDALGFFSKLQHHRVLWNDGPRLKALDAKLQALGLAPKELGKGRNVWYCMGYILASVSGIVALHDCDITTYDRELLAQLVTLLPTRALTTNSVGATRPVANGKSMAESPDCWSPLLSALKKPLAIPTISTIWPASNPYR